MQNNIPAQQPASAVAVIAAKLAAINIFAATPAISDAEKFKTAGVCFMSAAANLVASLSTNKELTRKQKQAGGEEALKMAAVADACMAHAAALSQAAEKRKGEA